MTHAYLSVFLDFIVLVFLGAVIFYILRLSRSLEAFKRQRREFDSVITNMIASIDQAERTVRNLKQAGAQEASALEEMILKSKALADELKIINAASESMAKRLENLAEENRKAAQGLGSKGRGGDNYRYEKRDTDKISSPVRRSPPVSSSPQRSKRQEDIQPVKARQPDREEEKEKDYKATLRTVKPNEQSVKSPGDIPSFMIKDREFTDRDTSPKKSRSAPPEIDDDIPDDLQSEAERELLAALRSSKNNLSRGGQ